MHKRNLPAIQCDVDFGTGSIYPFKYNIQTYVCKGETRARSDNYSLLFIRFGCDDREELHTLSAIDAACRAMSGISSDDQLQGLTLSLPGRTAGDTLQTRQDMICLQ